MPESYALTFNPTDTTAIALAEAAVQARKAMTPGWDTNRAAIACGRVLIGVLSRSDPSLTVEPVAMKVAWLSRLAVETDLREGHSIGVTGSGQIDTSTLGWDGHLVLLVNRTWLVDPSAEQFDRAAMGIPIGGPLVARIGDGRTHHPMAGGALEPGTMFQHDRSDGVSVYYGVMEDQESYRTSPDWREREARFAHAIERAYASYTMQRTLLAMHQREEKEHWRCAVCKRGLNTLSMPDGTRSFVHSRPWDPVDHEPVPEPATAETVGGVCDFCSDPDPTWIYTGPDVGSDEAGQAAALGLGSEKTRARSQLGTKWLGCDPCDRAVVASDLEALWETSSRSKTHRRQSAGLNAAQMEMVKAKSMRQWSQYVPYISDRRKLHPDPPPQLNPRLMPRMRTRLARLWREGGAKWGYGKVQNQGIGPDLGQPDVLSAPLLEATPAQTEAMFTRLADGVDFAEMFWISRDFTLLAQQAGADMQTISIRPEELPCPRGFMVWEIPIHEEPNPEEPDNPAETAHIVACSWMVVSGLGVWITVYVQPEAWIGRWGEDMRAEFGWLVPFGLGGGIDFETGYAADEGQRQDHLYKGILSTWFLLTQPGVATETREVVASGKEQRKAKRAGTRVPSVRMVDLRRHERAAAKPETEAEARSWQVSVRFMVRGHWKRQAYGPQRSLRKTIYVAPFLKGPDNAPLKKAKADTPIVKVLR